MVNLKKQFLLVEPIAKTPYPPLGLMKIANMLRHNYKGCDIFAVEGKVIPKGLVRPYCIYFTTLFSILTFRLTSIDAQRQTAVERSKFGASGH